MTIINGRSSNSQSAVAASPGNRVVRRTRRTPAAIALVLAASSACGGTPGGGQRGSAEVTALVSIAIVRSAPLRESLVSHGTVVPAPGSVRVLTAPFEAIVSRLHVSRGERVVGGQRLVHVAPSPDARLLIEAARAAVQTARSRTSDVRQRLQLGLTTRDELLVHEQVLADAEAKWDAYSRWVDGLILDAPGAGVVDRLPVSEGQRVPAGDPLVSVVSDGRFEVKLGVEPEDAVLIRVGQGVLMEGLAGAPAGRGIRGTVRSVSLAVDSSTRLTTVLASPTPDSNLQLLLGEFVRVVIAVRGATGLIVPRAALLPQESGVALFVVRAGRAFRRLVTIGVETDSLVQVTGVGLHVGDTVVVTGNYELTDSMRVRLPADSAAAAAMSPRSAKRK